jgi:Fe-S-cluster containining protein
MSDCKQFEIEVRGNVPAGDFSQWLHHTETSLRSRNGTADVPCGACRGCCRSSMFIHIRPEEVETNQRVPRSLLFPAPGLPMGHLLMGYGDKGQCPMLVDNRCSIYEHRPQTCRDYDCRVFAATGISIDLETQPEIAQRAREWAFTYESKESCEEHRVLQLAAAFLENNRDLFPNGTVPNYPVQLAALAVEIYRLFSELTRKAEKNELPLSDAAIARAIVAQLGKPSAEPVH